MEVANGDARQFLQVADELPGKRSIVHVGAGDHAGRGQGLVRGTTLHDERDPLGELLPVLAIFHPVIAVVRGERRVALAQKRDMFGAPDETHMGNWMDE
jgi:hypothetical protein